MTKDSKNYDIWHVGKNPRPASGKARGRYKSVALTGAPKRADASPGRPVKQALGVLAKDPTGCVGGHVDRLGFACRWTVVQILVILYNLCRDVVADHVLLGGPLGGGHGSRGHGESSARPVGNQVRRRRDARRAARRWAQADADVVANLAVGAGIAAGDRQAAAAAVAARMVGRMVARIGAILDLGVVSKGQALYSSLALLRDVSYDVCNSIRLVFKVTVSHIREA